MHVYIRRDVQIDRLMLWTAFCSSGNLACVGVPLYINTI